MIETSSRRGVQIGVTLTLLALSAAAIVGNDALATWLRERVPALSDTDGLDCWLFLLEAGALCLLSPLRCGLRLGTYARPWRLLGVFALPPVLVLLIYGTLTSRPFAGAPWELWLIQSVAQELFFTGVVYGSLSWAFEYDLENAPGPFSATLLLTPLCFAVWHWPNSEWLSGPYLVFQFVYTFLGGWWCLHLRRWTGSVLPGCANHVLVNYFASAL